MQKQVSTDALLVTSRDAATMLAISERSLWTLAKSGAIPRIKLGGKQGSVRFSVDALRRWVEAQALDTA